VPGKPEGKTGRLWRETERRGEERGGLPEVNRGETGGKPVKGKRGKLEPNPRLESESISPSMQVDAKVDGTSRAGRRACLALTCRKILPRNPLQISNLGKGYFPALNCRILSDPPRGDLWGCPGLASSDIEGTFLYPKKAPPTPISPATPCPVPLSRPVSPPPCSHRLASLLACATVALQACHASACFRPGFPVVSWTALSPSGLASEGLPLSRPGEISGTPHQVHGNPRRPHHSLTIAPGWAGPTSPLS